MIWKRETEIMSEGETEMIKRGKQIFYESPTTCHAFPSKLNSTLPGSFQQKLYKKKKL